MPSEVVQKENEINVETKEVIETLDAKSDTKENGSQQIKKQTNDNLEESKDVEQNIEDLSESENKENEEPTMEDVELQKLQAEELLLEGKRHLIIKDFIAAADVLSNACGLFGNVYGELSEKCADAYYNYGCALLELSKDQISPVGLEEKDDKESENEVNLEEESLTETDKNNVTNEEEKITLSNETEDKTSKEEICVDKENKLDNKSDEVKVKSSEKEISDEVEKTSTEKENDENDEVKETVTEKHEGNLKEISDGEDEKPDEEDTEEDEVNDLQLAWEMLELAKVIYKSIETEEARLKLAEVLMKCGEVSIEDEKFETAIQDMTESLEIRRLLLPEDDRIIAETIFQLGIAHELGGCGEEAITLLKEAVMVLEYRIKILERTVDSDEIAKKEVAEIKSIIPEIEDRIIDIKERKRAAVSALLAAVGASNGTKSNGESSSSASSSSTSKQASNISHLVRKRPKQEDSDSKPQVKIPKLEDVNQ